MHHRSQRGFTLIEVLVVTVVIGIIATISATSLFGALDRAKQRATMSDMRTISRAIEAYQVDNTFLPSDAGGLAALIPEMIPYSADVLPIRDHWGHDIDYTRDLGNGNYSIESFGKDGIEGDDIDEATRMEYERDILIFNGVFVAAPQ